MTIYRSIAALSVLLIAGSCANDNSDAPMHWLIGDWTAQDGAITEHWHGVSPDTLEGIGMTTSKDSVSVEYLRLVRMGDEVFFIAKVAHNDVPIAFGLTPESTPERAVFSNPAHDFPKQIIYQKDGPDNMNVIVSDGGTEGFELHFSRR